MTNDHDFGEFTRTVVDALIAADVEYLIGGAAALAAWGTGRSTNYFDLVVNIPFERVYDLSRELNSRDMLVPSDIIVDLLLQSEGDLPLNAIHLNSGYKAEFFLLRPGNTFRQNALARRTLVDLGPPLGEVYVHTPEDLILNKIHYYSISHQTKHLRDIADILTISRSRIDHGYIDTWTKTLGLTNTWQEMQVKIADILGKNEPPH
jgi:hypothetical protein